MNNYFNYIYSILTIFIIFTCIFLFYFYEYKYKGYEVPSFVNNKGILLLVSSISLLLFSFACQLKDESSYIYLLFFVLLMIFLFVLSLTIIESFKITAITSFLIFIFTFITTLLLALSDDKKLFVLTLPLLFCSLLILIYSHCLTTNNLENPFI